MWTMILGIVSSLVGWFTKKDERDVAHDDGLAQGLAEQQSQDQSAALKEMVNAKEAQDAVAGSIYRGLPGSATANDGFRRD